MKDTEEISPVLVDDKLSSEVKCGHRKILVFNTSFFDVSQTFIYQQVKTLEALGEVHLLASRFMNPHGFPIDSYKKHVATRNKGLIGRLSNKILKKNSFNLTSAIALNKLLREEQFSAVHAHFGTNALTILPYAKRYNIPLVVSFHGADASRMMRQPHFTRRLPALFDYASAIIISSRHMVESLGLQPWIKKVHLVVYGVETDFPAMQKNGQAPGKLKILHSGRITGKKGVPDLIRVFGDLAGRYDNIELHIAGNGPEMPECLNLVLKHNLTDKVIFYGSVSHDKVLDLLRSANIFVLNSRTADDGDMEGTPVTMLEAMSLGKAVVSTDHAGIPGVIENGFNGLLADERANDQLKESIEKLILDQKLRKKIGSNARDTIKNQFSIDILQQKLLAVYNTVNFTNI